MNKKELLKLQPCHEPERDTTEYAIATSRIIVDESSEGKNITEVDLWWQGELRARWFGIEKEDKYAVYFIGVGWKKVKLDNAARIIQGEDPLVGCEGYYYKTQYDWDSEEDERRVYAELGRSVFSFEYYISQEERKRAHDRRVRRINDLIASIDTVPLDMEEWLHRTIFPENYLFVKKHKKRTDYTCTVCGAKSWTKAKWAHNQTTICPKCGSEVIVKSRVQEIQDRQRVTLLQKLNKLTWVERLFIASCTWSETGKKLELYAEVCAVIPAGETWGTVYYGQGFDKDEFEQDWWDSNKYNKRWGNSFLYPGNLQEVLPMGGLQNSGMDIMAKAGRKFEVNKFIATFRERPYLEYLIKAGYLQMVADILHEYGWWGVPSTTLREAASTLKELFMLDGNRTNRLKQMDGGITALKWLQYEQQNGSRITQESLEYLQEQKITPYCLGSFIKELGSVNRAVNYLKKQKIKAKTAIEIWGDYLNMARNEGMDVTDDIVRFPKDLKARHDALVNIINERKDKERLKKEAAKYRELNKSILKNLPKTRIYFWENEKYMFVPAGKCEELVKEGRELHHCVGASDRYMNKMAQGESWIVFLRKKENIEKAYYTLEIDMKNDAVIQWYSEYDRKPDEKVISKLLTQYKNQIKAARLKETISQEKEPLVAAG